MPAAMQRHFEVALYLMVFTGFATLASTGGLGLLTVLMVSAALLFRGYLLIKGRNQLIAERWTTFLTYRYTAFYLADYFLFGRVPQRDYSPGFVCHGGAAVFGAPRP